MPVILTLALDFLKKYWQEFLGAFVVLALAGLVYAGYEHVVNIGYQKGLVAGRAEIQKQLDARLAQDALDNKALNDKITGLETMSNVAAGNEFAARAALVTAQGKIITKYVQANPTSANGCGIDKPMAKTINELLDADPSIVEPK